MTTSPPEENTPPTEVSVPVGDAIPAPAEPGLDQPIPEKSDAAESATQEPEPLPEAVTEVSKPIGDAIPTPVEPGTDQPLPEKDA